MKENASSDYMYLMLVLRPVRKMCQRAFQRRGQLLRPAGSVPRDPEPMVSLPSAPAVLLATSVQWGKWHSVSKVRYAGRAIKAMIISSQGLYLESRSWSQQASWACPSMNSHVRGQAVCTIPAHKSACSFTSITRN